MAACHSWLSIQRDAITAQAGHAMVMFFGTAIGTKTMTRVAHTVMVYGAIVAAQRSWWLPPGALR
jgi:tetrahydromethanopterin S-methyltransferase subunit B